jgi:hypothetical protein
VTCEQVAHPTLSVPHSFSPSSPPHNTCSRARSALLQLLATLPGLARTRCSLAVNPSWPSPDAAVACCNRILPPALTRLSRPLEARSPHRFMLHMVRFAAPRGQDSILAAVPPLHQRPPLGGYYPRCGICSKSKTGSRAQRGASSTRWLPPAGVARCGGRAGLSVSGAFFYIMFDFDPFPIDVVFIFYSIWDNDALVHFDFLF